MHNQPDSKENEWTILKVLTWTTSYFKSNEIESPRPSAEILLAHLLETTRVELYLKYDQPLNSKELEKFKTLIKRRVAREPVAYITGVKEFWSLELAVTKDVLIPRPETECLVEASILLLSAVSAGHSKLKPMQILELGTGSGGIILALAKEQPNHLYFASDCSIDAIRVAKNNAMKNNLNEEVLFFVADWESSLNHKNISFDLIISNPPYIPTGDLAGLQPEIFKYEPLGALDGKEDGLSSLKHIICSAHKLLKRYGTLILEIGHDQKAAVGRIIEKCGQYENIAFSKDYSRYDRVVQMSKK
ncbi:MAG: peptide chain release factor N(5)-glutamine methyltransferase [Deltaproteobacteria bacterium]|nr:peptide chain release factor N(5)-glutamine methyltransferase [Deltaproteobacteria bacterium]